jgi:hypothetical protein
MSTKTMFSSRCAAAWLLMMVCTAAAAGDHGRHRCLKDLLGNPVCAPPGGTIAHDLIGNLVCGPGHCLKNSLGQIMCSTQRGGVATTNTLGQVVCTGGCAPATAAACERPR